MPITYYPDRVQKRVASPVELLQIANTINFFEGGANLADGDLNALLWPKSPTWTVKQAALKFTETDPKDYLIAKTVGRGVISGLNDSLWFKTDGAQAQLITLDEGFYDNDSNKLVDELKGKLDENVVFDDLGLTPFSVVYTEATGLFTISPAAGTIQFLIRNTRVPGVRWDSVGGCLLGLTADTTMAANVVSDTPSFEFGQTFTILSATASATTSIYLTDNLEMSSDEALYFSASGAPMIASYTVSYKKG